MVNDQKMWTAIQSKHEISTRPELRDTPREPRDAPREPRDAPREPREAPRELPQEAREVRETCERGDMEGARSAVAALQGIWESQRDSSESYTVTGLDVVRQQRQGQGMSRRAFSLRWNVEKRCLEWGSGKYFLKTPEPHASEAVWLASDGGRGFAWRRAKGRGRSLRDGS